MAKPVPTAGADHRPGRHRVEGSFQTALTDSGFHGQTAALTGVARGACIAFASVGTGAAGDMVVRHAGLLRDGRLETMWYYAGDAALIADAAGAPAERREVPWWKAIVANADTFERVADTAAPAG